MSANSKQRQFVKQLRANGIDVEPGSKHLKIKHDGKLIGVLPHDGAAGSDRFRAQKNVVAAVKRETGIQL